MKVLNLKETFAARAEARAAQKRAYERIQKICDRANKEVEAFVRKQIDGFIMDKLSLTGPDEIFQYYEFVSKESGEDFDNYFLSILEEKTFLFRIKKITEEVDGNVTVSYIYEV